MGNHWGPGRDKESAGHCAVAVRAMAVGAVIAASVYAVGPSGFTLGQSGSGPSAAGAIQPGGNFRSGADAALPASTFPSADGVGQAGLPGLGGGFATGGFLTDSRALVPYSRPFVGTVAKGGTAPLNVASAGLKRPMEGALMAPLEVLTTSSPFGHRVSPLTGVAGDFHLGQDFAAGCGTRVYSADAGVVRAAGWHPWGGGNRVEIDHGNGLITTYNHLDAIAVRAGQSVQVGQVIARVGTTGWSTGCHLHFETILRGKHTSPLNWTFLPIRQLDELEDIAMVSFDGRSTDRQRWAIPVSADNSHAVLGGHEELSAPPIADTTPSDDTARLVATHEARASAAPSSGPAASDDTARLLATHEARASASPSPDHTPSETATQTQTPTSTEIPAGTPTQTETPAETPAGTPTQTETPVEPPPAEAPVQAAVEPPPAEAPVQTPVEAPPLEAPTETPTEAPAATATRLPELSESAAASG